MNHNVSMDLTIIYQYYFINYDKCYAQMLKVPQDIKNRRNGGKSKHMETLCAFHSFFSVNLKQLKK